MNLFHSEEIRERGSGGELLVPVVNPRKALEGRQIVAIMPVKRNVDLAYWWSEIQLRERFVRS